MYKYILHATDLCENHYAMCQQAAEIAKRFDATLYLLHVIEPPVSIQIAQGLGFAEMDVPNKDNAETVMSVLGDSLNIPSEHQFVEVGSINDHALTKAKELGCTLIIVGKHMQSHVPSFLDSSAHDIVDNAKCDVLILQ